LFAKTVTSWANK